MNLVIITSVINITNKLSAGVFSGAERFAQTLETVKSLHRIKNKAVAWVEGGQLTQEQEDIIKGIVDIYVNVSHIDLISGNNKSVGEAAQLLEALSIIDISNYENVAKISGRYVLTPNFNQDAFKDSRSAFLKIKGNINENSILASKLVNVGDSFDVPEFLAKRGVHVFAAPDDPNRLVRPNYHTYFYKVNNREYNRLVETLQYVIKENALIEDGFFRMFCGLAPFRVMELSHIGVEGHNGISGKIIRTKG
tara:strand:+ start:1321 stop:2073 length:753 start_codon:yes stop_codon:yes gene_type:complete